MADNQKKDFDFFSDEMESSIDSLFTPKRAIEIDPLTNQIKELEEQVTVAPAPAPSPAPATPPPPAAQAPPQASKPKDDLQVFLEELNQAVLTFEWEITDKNILAVKNYVNELASKVKLDNIVAKSIYTFIQDNLELMHANPLKIPAKGPIAIQRGLDIIILYIEKGDDAILMAGDSVSSTLTLLEDIKASFARGYKQISATPEPVEKEAVITEIALEPAVEEEAIPGFEIAILEDTEEKSAEFTTTESSESVKPAEDEQTFDSFDMALEQSLSASLTGKASAPVEEKITTEEPLPVIHLELVIEETTEMFDAPKGKVETIVVTKQTDIPLQQETKHEEGLQLSIQEFEEKPTPPPAPPETKKPSLPASSLKMEFAHDPDEIIKTQIRHFNSYIEKIKNLETVCCGIPSLNKLCMFAQTLRNEIENDKKWICQFVTGEIPSDVAPAREPFPEPTHIGKVDVKTAEKKEVKEKISTEHKTFEKAVVSDEFSLPEIYITVWGREKVGFIPDEISFDGNLPIWYRQKVIRMTNIPLKYLKQWPWSKISPLLRGRMSSLPEEKLSAMSLPLKKSPNHPLGISQNPNLLILFKENEGCFLFTDHTLQVKSTLDYKWVPAEEGDFIGYLQKDDEKIKIISLKRGS
jgi:hypothetical protein